jgi:lipopolysaccharide export LptBFGC system permease protein LptF
LLLTRSTGGRKLESNGVGGSGKGDWEKGNDRDAILIQEGNFPRGTALQGLWIYRMEKKEGDLMAGGRRSMVAAAGSRRRYRQAPWVEKGGTPLITKYHRKMVDRCTRKSQTPFSIRKHTI